MIDVGVTPVTLKFDGVLGPWPEGVGVGVGGAGVVGGGVGTVGTGVGPVVVVGIAVGGGSAIAALPIPVKSAIAPNDITANERMRLPMPRPSNMH
ncbi:hypothetical protein [Paractinoplanes lichenicola]|uniref:hypothetical protein n=1 Tax=Paractinoplanes lichenicola TaxID=2802976 RepID=UPI0027DD176F|nr:hypothetical protein [Actinoplanes lichenicola]